MAASVAVRRIIVKNCAGDSEIASQPWVPILPMVATDTTLRTLVLVVAR